MTNVSCGVRIANLMLEGFEVIVSAGIDMSKGKHDCFILDWEGKVRSDVFSISNNMDGFHPLLKKPLVCNSGCLRHTAKYICRWDPTVAAYLAKKRDEGRDGAFTPSGALFAVRPDGGSVWGQEGVCRFGCFKYGQQPG